MFFIFPVALFCSVLTSRTLAQTWVNGQLFTNALSIIDAPASQSTYTAGGVLSIAIDVSGDGKLPMTAATPGNNAATGYDNLILYLVSAQTNLNFSLSNNSDILSQESGSTVKHINWNVPSCISPGAYNMTLYEGSHINNQDFYTITPVPIQINNPHQSGQCTEGVNALESQPQPSSPSPQSPLIQNSNSTGVVASSNAASRCTKGSLAGVLAVSIVIAAAGVW